MHRRHRPIYITKDHPGIVEHDTEWLQTQLTSQQRHLWAERWVDGSVMSIIQGHTLIKNRKWISWSCHVKSMSKWTNQSWILLPQTESFRMNTYHWLEGCEQSYKMTSPGVFSPRWFRLKQWGLHWCLNCDDFYILTPFCFFSMALFLSF